MTAIHGNGIGITLVTNQNEIRERVETKGVVIGPVGGARMDGKGAQVRLR